MGALTSLSQRIIISLLVCMLIHLLRDVSSKSLVAWTQIDPSGSYLVGLPLGTPKQTQVLLTLDVKSHLTSLTCSSNLSSEASFHPSSSSTFHKLSKSTLYSAPSYLAQDNLTLIERTTYTLPDFPQTPMLSTSVDVSVPHIIFTCSSAPPPNTSSVSIGVVGFSTGRLGMPSQVAQLAGLAREFAYCLPSEEGGQLGPVVFGSRPEGYAFQTFPDPPLVVNMSNLPSRTPLTFVRNGGYAVSLQDIAVGGEALNLTKPVKLYISTTDRYTRLQRSVYRRVRASFRHHIAYGNTTSGAPAVPAVPPFDTCFNATSLRFPDRTANFFFTAESGQIDLLLGGDVSWGFYTDALVYASPDVLCLAILDAGRHQRSVLGTFQQRGRLLHFDLDKSTLGVVKVDNLYFSIPFLGRFRTCASFV